VCIIIPATPSLQQEQQALWQHQQAAAAGTAPPLVQQRRQHQQGSSSSANGRSASGPVAAVATAANLSPMMLVVRWASLALAAAPLVSNLGLVARTSSSVTLGRADAVVAAAVLDTCPALAPAAAAAAAAAADSVVLAVMASGWMWAGSVAGVPLQQVRADAGCPGWWARGGGVGRGECLCRSAGCGLAAHRPLVSTRCGVPAAGLGQATGGGREHGAAVPQLHARAACQHARQQQRQRQQQRMRCGAAAAGGAG
jgi:hypothetical protein